MRPSTRAMALAALLVAACGSAPSSIPPTLSTAPSSAAAPTLPSAVAPLALGAGERMWLSMFDTPAGVLAIAVRAATADCDAALLAVEPFLEQVVIEG